MYRSEAPKLVVVPLELKEANLLVSAIHRHHDPVVGHRFSLGVVDDSGTLHGACIVGRPVARLAGHPRDVAEVTRLVTDGTPNAPSMLYSAAARAARAMGYRRIQTYTLISEHGASLRASNWTDEGSAGGGLGWHSRPGRTTRQPTETKRRWAVEFSRPDIDVRLPESVQDDRHQCLFDWSDRVSQ